MGKWYDHIVAKGPTQREIADYLSAQRWDAFASPTERDITVVYDDQPDVDIAREVSHALNCVTLFMFVEDSDYLLYRLYMSGQLRDTYYSGSWPNPGTDTETRPKWHLLLPATGDAAALCAAFDREDAVAAVRDAVIAHRNGDECHERLCAALELRSWLNPGIDYDTINANPEHYLNDYGFAISGTRKPSRLQPVALPMPMNNT